LGGKAKRKRVCRRVQRIAASQNRKRCPELQEIIGKKKKRL